MNLKGLPVSELIKFLDSKQINPYYQVSESKQVGTSVIEGKRMMTMSPNDYLGLSQDSRVKKAGIDALNKYGTSCCGSRIANGTIDLHIELEKKLANFVKQEEAITFSTGMQANLGAISALFNDYYMLMDSNNHASIIDAAKLSKAKKIIYEYNNMKDLEKKLSEIPKDAKKVIITDGVFSMTGEIAKLPEMISLKKKYNAKIYLDDAHGLGVVGENGKGSAEYFDVLEEIDYFMGVFSKSFGAIGGFIAASKEDIFHLKYHARSLMFSASLPPSLSAIVLESIKLIENKETKFDLLKENINFFSKGLKEIGFETFNSITAIQSMKIGEEHKMFSLINFLKKHNVITVPVVYPGVPIGESLIRCAITANHTKEELTYILKILKIGKKEFNI